MAIIRRTDPAAGRAALAAWRDGIGTASDVKVATRFSLEEVAERHPGHSLELRVPPYGAVQCVEGPRHTRGTPPNVIETDGETWLALVSGRLSWAEALSTGRVAASGIRADLSDIVPLEF